eukprot:466909-Hanusia_phi.AAC.1
MAYKKIRFRHAGCQVSLLLIVFKFARLGSDDSPRLQASSRDHRVRYPAATVTVSLPPGQSEALFNAG